MSREWFTAGVVAASMGLGVLALPNAARADDVPANAAASASIATPPPPPAATNATGCPYANASASATGCPYQSGSYGGGHCCCSCGRGLRWGVAVLSLATLTTAVALHVASVNLDADVSRMYDLRDPNHSLPRTSYADLAQLDGQHQAMQNWAIGLYVGGGVLTALSVASFVLPAVWRHRTTPYVPTVAVGPTSATISLRF